MANFIGTPDADTLIAGAAGDRLFGLGGDDILRSNFADAFMDGGSGNDTLRQSVNLADILVYDDRSFFKAGSGDDRVILQTRIDSSDVVIGDGFPDLALDHTILTESGDDFVFIDNNLLGRDIQTAAVSLDIIDLIGDNRLNIRNTVLTETGFASANTDILLGGGDDVVRYTGDVTDFSSFARSEHVFDLGDGDNRLVYRDVTGDLDFDLTSGDGRDVINIRYQIDDDNTNGLDGNFDISTGGGNDVVIMDVQGSGGFSQNAQSVIDLGEGNNFLRMTQDIVGPITVTAGDGNDRFDLTTEGENGAFVPEFPFDIAVDLGGGDNRVTVDLEAGDDVQGYDFNLVTGDGRDRIDFDANIDISDAADGLVDTFMAQIDMGGGNDQINVNFADLTLTTGEGADIVRLSQSAITEEPSVFGEPLRVVNPGHNTLVLTDFDFEAGDRFVFRDFDGAGSVETARSVADLEALVISGDAISLNSVGGDLILELAGAGDLTGLVIFEGLGDPGLVDLPMIPFDPPIIPIDPPVIPVTPIIPIDPPVIPTIPVDVAEFDPLAF